MSDTHALRLFELRPGASEGEEWTLRKQDSPEGGVSCAHLLLFTPDGKVLVAVGASGAVNVIDLESWEVMEVIICTYMQLLRSVEVNQAACMG